MEACRAADTVDFIHPRFKAQKTTAKQLLDREVYIGPCVDPPVSVIADIVKVLGGARVSALTAADIVIVGISLLFVPPLYLRGVCRGKFG